MSLTKIEFADKTVEVYKIEKDGEDWMAANPFAEALGYTRLNYAVAQHVSQQNQKTFEEIKSQGSLATDESCLLPRNIQAKTKFINRAGVFELINSSDMPAAKRFKTWNTNDLLPILCQEGEYSMATNAPADIAQGMNAVHAATNEGREAPWIENTDYLKNAIVEKDQQINQLTVALQDSNQKLSETNDKLITFASALINANNALAQSNTMINEARKDSENARKETADLANRMADIAQDVIAKPSDPQLLHSLAVCAIGGDQYAFLRPQKRSLKRSLDRLSVDEKDIVFRSEYVPNAMNVLNKVKERLPKDKFKARHNRITLHENLTREDLLDAIESTVTARQVAIIVNKACAKTMASKD
uniref:Baculovirus repeated ORF s n=1 Tax=Lymantria dispar multicapsid nuclear polyhedrosis virus TaxID=10449 RepID=A0A1B1MR21_NPVLD|nr:baculovirus repeated ORF s [Lymantria dispar multiple nucleopolyhedrovirus]